MKKLLKILSVILSLTLVFGAFGAFAVHADIGTHMRDVCVFYYNTVPQFLNCLFTNALPNIPFINVEDYLEAIYVGDFETTKYNGIFTITNPYGSTMVIDAIHHTVTFENYDSFIAVETNEENISIEINYMQYAEDSVINEPSVFTIKLDDYGVPAYVVGDKMYLPLNVLGAMFSSTYNNAVYYNNGELEAICFVHTFDPESYYDEFDQSYRFQSLTRTAAEALFNYNTLCLYFDCFFGRPSNTLLAESMETMRFDEALDNYNEYTQLAKQLLLSESMVDYFNGIIILGCYVYDGGHTFMMHTPLSYENEYFSTPLIHEWFDNFSGDSDEALIAHAHYESLLEDSLVGDVVVNTRETEYEQYKDEIVAEYDSGAYLIIHGNLAVFVFDNFETDTPYELLDALQTASEAGVKNFLLDDSCNGGGYVATYKYIVTLITNKQNQSNKHAGGDLSVPTGGIYGLVYEFDLDLDGDFDEDDETFCFDFNFAILTSKAAFSCGNTLPVDAASQGVMILGENSGGGSCYVSNRYFSDGFDFPISDIHKSVISDLDIDLGAPVDEYLVEETADGKNYAPLYDFDNINELITAFYACDEHVPGDTVIENEVPATVEEGGSYDEVVYCAVCGEEISRETVYTDPLAPEVADSIDANVVTAIVLISLAGASLLLLKKKSEI